MIELLIHVVGTTLSFYMAWGMGLCAIIENKKVKQPWK